MVLQREKVKAWDLSGLKDIFQVFDQLVILSRSEEREEAAACVSERWGMSRHRVLSSVQIKGIFQRKRKIFDEDQ